MPEADAVVAGEFDVALPALVERWAERGEGPCPGIIERRDGRIVDHGDRPLLVDLDELPDFDWAAFPLQLYSEPGVLRWSTARGCVRRCVFCEQTIWEGARRASSAERLAGEIERQLERLPDLMGLYFDDIVINAEPGRLERFCVLLADIRRRRLAAQFARWPAADLAAGRRPEFSWTCQGIVDERRLKPSLLRAMADSGCVQISYGVESGSARVVESMRKGFTIPEAERVVRSTAEAGIAVNIHYLPGFPTETEDDFEESIRFLERNRRWLTSVDAGSGCYIAPFTPLGLEPGRYGVEEPVHPSYWRTVDGRNTFPVRWDRRDRFFRSAKRLGLRLPSGWRFDSPDKWIFHRDYYRHAGNEQAARRCERRLEKFSSWKPMGRLEIADLSLALAE